jgi:hypothetical protein
VRPTAFSAVIEAFAKETCTCDEMALTIVGSNGMVPVMFGPDVPIIMLDWFWPVLLIIPP